MILCVVPLPNRPRPYTAIHKKTCLEPCFRVVGPQADIEPCPLQWSEAPAGRIETVDLVADARILP